MLASKNPIEVAYLRLSSADADDGGTDTDFVISTSKVEKLTDVVAFSIKSITFPNVFTNVTAGRDDIFQIWDDTAGAIISVTLDEGFYTQSEIISAITVGGPAGTWTTPTGGIAGLITGGNFTATATHPNKKITFASSTDSFKLLTFVGGSTSSTNLGITTQTVAAAASVEADHTPSLAGLTECYLRSSTLSKVIRGATVMGDSSVQDIIQTINVSAPHMGVNTYEPADNDLTKFYAQTPVELSKVDLRLTNEAGQKLNLQNNRLVVVLQIESQTSRS